MNVLEYRVDRIVEGPHHVEHTDDQCCHWEVVVEYRTEGGQRRKTLSSTSRHDIEGIKPGNTIRE